MSKRDFYPTSFVAKYDADLAKMADDGCPLLADDVYDGDADENLLSARDLSFRILLTVNWTEVVFGVVIAFPPTAAMTAAYVLIR